MADRQVGKSWGPCGALALTAVILTYALIAPVCARADSSVPSSVDQLATAVTASTQAAVNAAVSGASAAPVAAVAAAAVSAPVRAAADAVTASAHVAAVAAPVPQTAPAMPHVSMPAAPNPAVAPSVPQVNVPHVTLPRAPVPSPQRAPSHTSDPVSSAAAVATRQAGSVGAGLATPHGRSAGRPAVAKPSGSPPARPRAVVLAHQAARPVFPPIAWHPISAAVASVKRVGPLPPVHAARSAERRRPPVIHRAPMRDLGLMEASATAWPTVPTTASLPPGGAGGPSAGGSGGAAGGIAAAVLALAALALFRGFLPGLLALDVVPWRSALLAFRLERPG